jgi:succinate dehydrogenase/fumarate reductase flavoprotein subunit
VLLRTQPDRRGVFAWLRVVAVHEAHRLSAIERRETRLASLRADHRDGDELVAVPHTLDDALEALEALRAPAALPAQQRVDLTSSSPA